jgi:hypothetical protein
VFAIGAVIIAAAMGELVTVGTRAGTNVTSKSRRRVTH